MNISTTDIGVQIVLFNDDETPLDFVIELLQRVFGKSEAEARACAELVNECGRASCGSFPRTIAEAMLAAARQRIAAYNYPLKLDIIREEQFSGCDFCGQPGRMLYKGQNAQICDECILIGADHLSEASNTKRFKYAFQALNWHLAGLQRDQIVSSSRQFPGHMRADVQRAVDRLFADPALRFFGVYEQYRYETLTFAALTKDGQHAHLIAPPQYHDVDVGDDEPAKCLENGLWLCRANDVRFVVVLSHHREPGEEAGTRIEITAPACEIGSRLASNCFATLEVAVNESKSYRGKILSLEQSNNYHGTSKGVTVHRLPTVARSEVILPEATLRLLDRNVLAFVDNREQLRKLGQPTKKGILLYGPPGTGKTHTIRYLASNLKDHTTLIITAQQVAFLRSYMSLARLLQPSLVVVEDVDLIARSREEMDGPCQESMLNQLLNEMDGLKEDADILFALTTNRPEDLEFALAGRPGRVDQAIEMPLPDAMGREKLVQLYSRGLKLDQSLVDEAVRRTDGVSAAFIKEMMRRTAQASIERGNVMAATLADVNEALNDMLFTCGRLNASLLGANTAAYPLQS